MTDRIDTDAIVALKRIADQKWNDEVTVSRDDLAALLADHARLSDEGLAEMVRQMSLHSLGCSGSVGTDGVECEWPDEGPCLVASLRAEVDRLRAEVYTATVANRITENHNHFDCAAEMTKLRIERDVLLAAPASVGLTPDERELVDRVLANEGDPEYEKSAIIDFFAAEALHKVFDGPTVQEIRHARYVMAKRASDMVSDRFRLAQAIDRLSAAPDDRERVPEGWRVEWYQPLYTKPLRPRLVPVSPSVDPEDASDV